MISLKCPEEVIEYMHELLDGDISPTNERLLREHLTTCSECNEHFEQLKKVISLVRSSSRIQASENFTANVMANLPKKPKKFNFQRWFQQHPFLFAASLFLMLMSGGLVSSWQKDHEFSFSKDPNLVVKNKVVTVPKGKVVKGDIIVRNGELRVEGEIQGDVTVINGNKFVASAGHVTGEIEEVNKVFDWVWYQMKKTSKQMASMFNSEGK
jgi:anti-sigma factor RsiW